MEPQPSQKFKHFKGGIYKIVTIALDSDNPEKKIVVHKSIIDGKTWARSLEEFIGFKEFPDGSKVKRFELIP